MNTLTYSRRVVAFASASAACALLTAASAGSQTVTLTQSNATTLRGGSYASTNYSSDHVVETRASDDPTYERRALLKFDTDTTIPAGASIASAKLTVTVAGGNSESRQLSAYSVTSSYDEAAATWNSRSASSRWSKAGGDLGAKYDTATITGAVGSKGTFDVTNLVQSVVKQSGTRYTRIALVDDGSS